jgi:hypothetical protein
MGHLVPAVLLQALNDLPAGHQYTIHTFYTRVKPADRRSSPVYNVVGVVKNFFMGLETNL